ncbi:MAG: SulP family inorganic anion transporter [Acidobacteriota bacterium]
MKTAVPQAPLAQKGTLAQDALASVVVFLVALPLCMGIAIASGAPPAAGLITGIIGGLVVGAISGCPLQVSGPAAGLAVIVLELIREHGFAMLGPIVVLAGLMQIAAGLLKVGQMFRSIAPAVVFGMLAGIGVLIFAAQFHVMVDDTPRANGIRNLLALPEAVYKAGFPGDGAVHHLAAFIGITTIVLLVLWAKFVPLKLKWVPGALVGVTVATAIAQLTDMPIKFVDLPDNLFATLRFPTGEQFMAMLNGRMLLESLTVAFVASAETLLSASAVDQMHNGPKTNYDKELISQGVGNSLAGFVGGLPMTGVIVRSATNVTAGAKTRLSAVLHGAWLLVLVAAAPSVLRLVPTASLAAVLVYTGYKLVNVNNIKRLFHYGGMPVAIYAVTLSIIVVEDLLTGIVCGLVLSLISVVYSLTHLAVNVDQNETRVDVHLDGAATFIRMPMLIDSLEKLPHHTSVHVHIHKLTYIDHACMEAISNWEKQRNSQDADTVVEWQELMVNYNRANPLSGKTESRPLVGAGH